MVDANGAETSAVQYDSRQTKDNGCDRCRSKGRPAKNAQRSYSCGVIPQLNEYE